MADKGSYQPPQQAQPVVAQVAQPGQYQQPVQGYQQQPVQGYQQQPVQGYQQQPVQQPYQQQPVQQAGVVYAQPAMQPQPTQTTVLITGNPAYDSSESTARLLFVIGIFVALVGWINMCMHCGHPNPNVSKWARYSAIVAAVQALFIIIIIVIEVVVLGNIASNTFTCDNECIYCYSQSSCQGSAMGDCTWNDSGFCN